MNTSTDKTIKIALVDDHALIRSALKLVIEKFSADRHPYKVVLQANHGQEFIDLLSSSNGSPDMVILDIHMPKMNGLETSKVLKRKYPDIKILILTMSNDEDTIISAFQNGAKGYLTKDVASTELKDAIDSVISKGVYFSNQITETVMKGLMRAKDGQAGLNANLSINLTDREIEFLKLIASDMSYSQVAEKMLISPRTVDGYRESLFSKFKVSSRVGLALAAMKQGIIV